MAYLEANAKAVAGLEADFEDLAVVADEPAGVGVGEGDGPVAADTGELVPGVALVGAPRGGAGGEVGQGLGGDDDGSVVDVAEAG